MTRTNAREIAVHFSFELGFFHETADELLDAMLTPATFKHIGEEEPLYAQFPEEEQKEYIRTLVRGVYDHCPELDGYISRYSIGWKFSRIPRVAVSIMRVAMYEILYMPEIPAAASINDAVDIAKKYEDEKVAAFINGILGTFVRTEFPDQAAPKPEQEG